MPTPDAAILVSSGWRHTTHLSRPVTGQIDLWLLLCADYQARGEALLQCLSTQEQQAAKRKKIPTKQFEYILGQAAARRLLAHALSIPHDQVRYVRGHKGKPALDPVHQRRDLHFNISHSGGVIVVALSTVGEVGIDIEAINTHTSIDLVSRRAFSEHETEALQNQSEPARRHRFFQLWTCKEAVVKCTGDGIHSGMNQFTVIFPRADEACISEAKDQQAKTSSFSITPLDLGLTHKGALVCADSFQALNRHYLPERLV